MIIFLSISLNMCLCAQKNLLIETVLSSTHNICVSRVVRKAIFKWRPETFYKENRLNVFALSSTLQFQTIYLALPQLSCILIDVFIGLYCNSVDNVMSLS